MKPILILIAVPLIMPAVLIALWYFLRNIKPPKKIIRGDITIISHRGTPWMKKMPLLVAIVLFGFLGFLVYIFLLPGRQDLFVNTLLLLFSVLWIYSVYALISTFARLKEVGYGHDFLFVSNFQNSIRVPFSEIENIWTKNKYTGGRAGVSHTILIFVSFKRDTPFGRTVFFMPYVGEVLSKGEEHSVAVELKKIIGLT